MAINNEDRRTFIADYNGIIKHVRGLYKKLNKISSVEPLYDNPRFSKEIDTSNAPLLEVRSELQQLRSMLMDLNSEWENYDEEAAIGPDQGIASKINELAKTAEAEYAKVSELAEDIFTRGRGKVDVIGYRNAHIASHKVVAMDCKNYEKMRQLARLYVAACNSLGYSKLTPVQQGLYDHLKRANEVPLEYSPIHIEKLKIRQ